MSLFHPQSTLEHARKTLTPYIGIEEASSISYIILEKVFEKNKVDIILNSPYTPSDSQQLKYEDTLKRLSNHEPIQYILQEADFYGRQFYVTPDVLIPRQETESLIEIIRTYKEWVQPKVADIGVGSGCIACTLDLELESATVHGFDISTEALKVATRNNSSLGANVQFHELDILSKSLDEGYDIIVSNPPYVTNSEKQDMKRNVLDFEPSLALFVSDEDPLLFYRTITEKALNALKSGGVLLFEINEQFGEETLKLLNEFNFIQTEIHQDLHGKDRFSSAIKP